MNNNVPAFVLVAGTVLIGTTGSTIQLGNNLVTQCGAGTLPERACKVVQPGQQPPQNRTPLIEPIVAVSSATATNVTSSFNF